MIFRSFPWSLSRGIRFKTYFGVVLILSLVFVWGAVPLMGRGIDTASAGKTPTTTEDGTISVSVVKKHYALALAEYYSGDYNRAHSLFSGLTHRVPGYLRDDIQFWRAECAFRLGDLTSAEDGLYC